MRNDIKIGISLLLLIIIIVIGIIWYSYTQIQVSLIDVQFHSIELTPISLSTIIDFGLNLINGNWLETAFNSIDGINLEFLFAFTNNGIIPLYIPDLSYNLSINKVNIGNGNTVINAVIAPGDTKEISSMQNFKRNSFGPAIDSIIDNDGKIEITVTGTAYFNFFGQNIPIPFESTKQISLVDEIKNSLDNEINRGFGENN